MRTHDLGNRAGSDSVHVRAAIADRRSRLDAERPGTVSRTPRLERVNSLACV